MTQPIATVMLDWDGHRWQEPGTIIEIDERIETDGVYRPRRLLVSMDLGATALELIAAGHHHATARCAVWMGSALVYDGTVTDLSPGRVGEASLLTLAGHELDLAAMVPASKDVWSRQIDVSRSLAREARQEASIAAQINAAYGFAGNRPLYLTVLEPGEQAPRMNGLDGRAVVWYVETRGTVVVGESVAGRVYPWVFGRPGVESSRPGARAYPVDVDAGTIMIAGHHGTEGTVTIRGPKHSSSTQYARETLTATNSYDSAGTPIMTVNVSTSTVLEGRWTTSHPEAAEAEWFAIWDGTAAGLPNGAVDVLSVLMSAQSAPVDYGRLESVRGLLSGYLLDGSIDARTPVWDVIQGAILPLLPVALVDTIDGIGLAYMDYGATAADAREHLEARRNVDPVGRPQWLSAGDSGAIANRVTVSYAPARDTAAPAAVATVSPLTHAQAARSVSVHGDRPYELVTGWVHRRAVAEAIARDVLDRRATDRRAAEYLVDAAVYGAGQAREMRIGDVYTLTDVDERITAAACIVTGIRRDGSGSDVVRLMLL